MSFRDQESGGEDGGRTSSASDLRKPLLNTGSWYRMPAAGGMMGSRQSSLMERLGSSAFSLRDVAISATLCTLIVALGPIQFGFTCGYSSPTQDAIIADLGLSLSEVNPSLFPRWCCIPPLVPCNVCTCLMLLALFFFYAVLALRIVIKRRGNGRRHIQWATCRVYRTQGGENTILFCL